MSTNSTVRRLAITVRGVVQGVGFRPFVYHSARAEHLVGWVQNESDAVRIEVQGQRESLDRFVSALRRYPPPQATIESVDIAEIAIHHSADAADHFQIRTSSQQSKPRPSIPADLATCPACLDEVFDPTEHRHLYPFTNCTNCGPRWSIITRLPYDRPHTTMNEFILCDRCRAEYDDPADRRFHAQPIACPTCGPQLRLLSGDGQTQATASEALTRSAQAVLAGEVLALKGIGGFQLIVDATNGDAVTLLRQRKRRPHKPLAVMLAGVDHVRQHCQVSTDEAAELCSHAAPIVLIRRRTDADATHDVATTVAPHNPYLGVMLPYTPLHHLLLAAIDRPVVCTSGNLSEEPMATTTDEAIARLGKIADWILTHNRPIVRPVDDSIVRLTSAGPQVFRRARGYAPRPLRLDEKTPRVLAVGGHLKNTVALALESQVILSPHIGDLDNTLSVEVHRRAISDLCEFFAITPGVIACDLHPDYASTRHAEQLATAWDCPLVRVQHHHAHVVSCAAEHALKGPVLGFSWDGTGYGADGTVWGGEALLCEGGDFSRIAHLRTFSLPGGDRAARQPRRSALGVVYEIWGQRAAGLMEHLFEPAELKLLLSTLDRPGLCPRTSSMGRLFDAVAVLCGGPPEVSYEGQAAMELEFAAAADVDDAYPFPLTGSDPVVADWEPLVRAVVHDRSTGCPASQVAARFHNALARMVLEVAQRADCPQVALSGGCFQNSLLTERVRTRLLKAGFAVYTQQLVPPGDGGIALGQIVIAARQTKESFHVSGNSR